MRIIPSTLILLFGFLIGCTATKSGQNVRDLISDVQPLQLVMDSNFAFETDISTSVAKVYRGNGFVQSGAFISGSGLFVTNYPIALEYFSTADQTDINWLSKGFYADSNSMELVLPGVSLLIEIAQNDISEEYNSIINENSTNAEIAQIKQNLTQQIIQTEREKDPNIIVQINELFSGRQFILSKFQVIRDIRLVYAPASDINVDVFTDTNYLLTQIENKPVFLRAYVDGNGNPATFSSNNIPFETDNYLRISKPKAGYQQSIAVGFPDRSFRLDPFEALEFYNQVTNPNIINSYQAFLAKEERLAKKDRSAGVRSIANRVNILQNLNYYNQVQKSFTADSILDYKKNFDDRLQIIIEADSATNARFGGIYYYLNQAYEIAHQQGATYYATSYFLALSRLDEFAKIANDYLNNTDQDDDTRKANLLSSQFALLTQTNIEEELLQFADFLFAFSQLPDAQKPFSILDLDEQLPNASSSQLVSYVQNELANSTVLFDRERLSSSIENNSLRNDPLFLILDELIFSQELSRNNQSIFVAYAQPVKKIYNDAIFELLNNDLISADANGTLRTNTGKTTGPYTDELTFNGFFNFTSKAPGSAILNEEGNLLGIIGDEIPENVTDNYLFMETQQNYSIINIDAFLEQARKVNPHSKFIREIEY